MYNKKSVPFIGVPIYFYVFYASQLFKYFS